MFTLCYIIVQNWEYFSIISVFGVIFGQNLGYDSVPGCPFIGFLPTVIYAIDIKDKASRFNLNAFLRLLCVI